MKLNKENFPRYQPMTESDLIVKDRVPHIQTDLQEFQNKLINTRRVRQENS